VELSGNYPVSVRYCDYMTNTIKACEVKPGMIVVIGSSTVGIRSASTNGDKVYLMTDSWDTHAVNKEDNIVLIKGAK
jgi:SUMO ligase MMS21 Smc5/6 complex component